MRRDDLRRCGNARPVGLCAARVVGRKRHMSCDFSESRNLPKHKDSSLWCNEQHSLKRPLCRRSLRLIELHAALGLLHCLKKQTFATAANVRNPPFMSSAASGPSLTLAVTIDAAMQLPESRHWRMSTTF